MIVGDFDPRTCGTCEYIVHRTTDEHGYCLRNGCKKHGEVGGNDGKDYRCGDWKKASWFTEESWKEHVDNMRYWAMKEMERKFKY